jgi:hypothetical protein
VSAGLVTFAALVYPAFQLQHARPTEPERLDLRVEALPVAASSDGDEVDARSAIQAWRLVHMDVLAELAGRTPFVDRALLQRCSVVYADVNGQARGRGPVAPAGADSSADFGVFHRILIQHDGTDEVMPDLVAALEDFVRRRLRPGILDAQRAAVFIGQFDHAAGAAALALTYPTDVYGRPALPDMPGVNGLRLRDWGELNAELHHWMACATQPAPAAADALHAMADTLRHAIPHGWTKLFVVSDSLPGSVLPSRAGRYGLDVRIQNVFTSADAALASLGGTASDKPRFIYAVCGLSAEVAHGLDVGYFPPPVVPGVIGVSRNGSGFPVPGIHAESPFWLAIAHGSGNPP